ncbi:fungal-specific transcription factor domain-containing protein [Coniochaeta sp. 2T2.1]|nr:fungal-specific transcription factor domain-containing protein [Coniochaeta sp. 2T2.1]
MPEYGQDHFENGPATTPSPTAHEVPLPTKRRPARRQSTDISEDDDTSLVDGVAYLSLCASGTTDTAPEPFYLGSSSGATIARMIQSSIFRSSKLSLPSPSSPGTQDVLRPTLTPVPRSPVFEEGPRCEFPPRAQAQALFGVFFDRLHTRWPILDRKLYYHLFEQQYDQGALPLIQRSILHLVYAISSRFLQLTKKNHHVDPQTHFTAAIEPMDYILEHHNLATVQFLVLLAIHGQRSPYGAGAWSQVRYALTTCVELGLHRVRTMNAPSQNARELEVRRRVFWACYCQDRTTSLLLGRTFGIADRDINVELPSASAEFWDLTSPGSPPPPPPESENGAAAQQTWSNILPFIHIVKLRKLQSKIHRTVFRVDKDILSTGTREERARLDRKISAICTELDAWAAEIPNPPRDSKCITWMYDPESAYHHDSRDFFTLQYHKTILSLYTALLPTVATSDARFTSCARSASRVCTAYKRLNQQKTLSYTITALHSCFIAGLTLVYCLWRDSTLFSYQALEAVRACSLCLTIFGEKWPGAVKYRDIFDALSASLFKAIVSPTKESTTKADAIEVEKERERKAGMEQDGMRRRSPLDITIQSRGSPVDAGQGGDPHMRDTFVDVAAEVPGTNVVDGSGLANMGREGLVGEGHIIPPNTMVLGAVKEAFMEVDEEAPGGWQGWRMFSEMVQQGGDIVAAAAGISGLPHQGMGGIDHTTAAALHGEDDDTAMHWDAADDGQFDGSGYNDIYYQAAADGFMGGNAAQRWGVEGI